jgi:hypothetical protein
MKPKASIKQFIAALSLVSILTVTVSAVRSRTAQGTIPSQGAASYIAPQGFEEQSPLPGTRVWKGNDSAGATIVLLEKQMSNVEMPPENDQEYKERLNSTQQLPRLLAGIKNFKVDTIERTKLPGGVKVVLMGTYTNSNNDTIRFEKWEYFLNTGYSQIAYSARESEQFPSRENVSNLLKGYIPSGT